MEKIDCKSDVKSDGKRLIGTGQGSTSGINGEIKVEE